MWGVRRATNGSKSQDSPLVVDANSRRDQEKGEDWDYRGEKG